MKERSDQKHLHVLRSRSKEKAQTRSVQRQARGQGKNRTDDRAETREEAVKEAAKSQQEKENKGLIFDIRRFSTHDGDGIRTTVFLKGCPLRCVWCQNPEGLSREISPMHMENKCIGCGTCVALARDGGMQREDGRITLHRERHEDWAALADACPAEALVLDSRFYSVPDLLTELRKDAVFFRHGGGVTFSGGDPLLQAGFVAKVAEALQEEGIHTAIETELGVSRENVDLVLPHIDQIFADMKVDDDALHRRYTGVSNRQIKENLTRLLTGPYRERVIVRTPLIPGYTATEENLRRIAHFLSALCPDVHYELLGYNPLAQAKYHLVGREYCFSEEDNPKLYTKEQMQHFAEIVRENGIRNLIEES